LPFNDNIFDVVFCHTLFQHLKEPSEALKEIYRTLKPGGLVALRDDDSSSLILAPETPEMTKVLEIMKKIIAHKGGTPFVGKNYKHFLLESGFKNLIVTTSCECDSKLEDTKMRGKIAKELLTTFKNDATKLGWVTDDEMENLIKKSEEWGSDPRAFDAIIWCKAIGFKN
jgi:ubiquinone/menaquinone biosynthesis C-methylase UbiE